MSEIHKDLEPKEFPESYYVNCRLYCSQTGLIAREECTAKHYGWYKTTGQKYCTEHGGDVINIKTEEEAKEYIKTKYGIQTDNNTDSSGDTGEGNQDENSSDSVPTD